MSKGSVRQRSAGSWELKWEIGNDPLTGLRCTRTATVRGKKSDALEALRAKLTAVDKGEEIAPSKQTVSQWVKDRIEIRYGSGKLRERAYLHHLTVLKTYIAPYIGAIPLQKLTTVHVEQWHTKLRNEGRARGIGGLSPRSCKDVHTLLSSTLREAVKHGLLSRNVASLQGAPKTKRPEIQILQEADIPLLLDGLHDHRVYPVVFTTLHTGLRQGEVLALSWKHVDLVEKVIKVRVTLEKIGTEVRLKECPKTDAGRRDIDLPQIVVDVLQEHRRAQLEQRAKLGLGKPTEDALVFPHLDGVNYQKLGGFASAWYILVRKRKLPIVSFHSLRHTHASQLIASNRINIMEISKRLGHTDAGFTLRTYGHLYKTGDRTVANLIDEIWGRAG